VAIRSWIARPAPIQVRLNIRFRKLQARRATIDDHADAAAMGFAPSRYTEQVPKDVRHKSNLRENRKEVKRRPDAKRILIVPPKRLGGTQAEPKSSR